MLKKQLPFHLAFYALLVSGLLVGPLVAPLSLAVAAETDRPNFVVILVDDVGYGDIGCFGGTRARTPHIDHMAKQGVRFTDFYAHPVCGVTRAAFMTGSYAMRVGEVGNRKVPHPVLHPEEITIAETLKAAGYRTGMIGKWHLAGGGRFPKELLPNAQGFDYWFGAPSHNGYTRAIEQSRFRMQLMRNGEMVDNAIDQKEMDQITQQYTDEAVGFIEKNKDKPFFLYLAHTMAHVVLGATEKHRGKSPGGLYGDVIEEIDSSVGQVLQALKNNGIDERTLVIFTSDNGPWVEKHLAGKGGNDTHYGTAKPLRGAKMMTWEGGLRVPTVVRWPKQASVGKTSDQPATIMDLYPTFAKLAGAKLPDRTFDGKDITPLIQEAESAKSPHEAIYYYAYTHLQAVRSGKWKLVLPRPARPRWTSWSARMIDGVPATQLYDLKADIGETRDVAAEHPDVVERLMKLVEKGRADLGDYNRLGSGQRFFDDGPRRPDLRAWQGKPSGNRTSRKPKPNPKAKVTYDKHKPAGKLRFDFESGDLQGWKVVSGKFDQLVTDRAGLPSFQDQPFNKQGRFLLFTGNRKGQARGDDSMTGIIESPVLTLAAGKGATMAFLVGGGKTKQTAVALYDQSDKPLFIASGNTGPVLRRVVWPLERIPAGTKVYLRVFDQSTGGWGHVTFDDFSVEATIDEKATKTRRSSRLRLKPDEQAK